jgi:hypothetical protein
MPAHFLRVSPSSRLLLLLVPALAVAGPLQSRDATQDAQRGIRRVRHTGDPMIAALIEEGIQQSVTFRGLVETIDATDGIVYVERGACPRGSRACLVHKMVVAGPNRILRVHVHINRGRAELIGAIGHELHHAADVLGDPAITTSEGMFLHFFRGQSLSVTGRMETAEAIRVGLQIEGELSRSK